MKLTVNLLFLFGLSVLSAAQEKSHPVGYRADIDAFLREDKKAAPPAQGILFIGSSIFRGWTELKTQMAPLPTFNRAFGGSKTWEINAYFDEIVKPYRPSMIVYYCGSNDINAGESAKDIADRTESFIARVEKELPGTTVVYASILKAPQKKDKWNVVEAINSQLKEYCKAHPNRTYIDLNPAVFNPDGAPRTELYVSDMLHYKPEAYIEFTKIVKPILVKLQKT